MAKKKKAESEETEKEELEGDEFEDEEFESEYPKIEKKPPNVREYSSGEPLDKSEEGQLTEVEEAAPFDLGVEAETKVRDYKHLKLGLYKGKGENDYELTVEGQSHGFCNVLVKHLLATEGVNIAAYKITSLTPPKIFIRLENESYKIKDIVRKSIESLREEVLKVQKLFTVLM